MNKTTVIAIIAICVLEGVALARGIDGAALSGALALIAGLGGYTLGKVKSK
ncbi:hypothetical protein ES708_29016 [subsurface metagenome]